MGNRKRTRVIKARQTKRLTSHDGSFSSRALFPLDEGRRVEFYELEVKVGGVEEAYQEVLRRVME